MTPHPTLPSYPLYLLLHPIHAASLRTSERPIPPPATPQHPDPANDDRP